MWDYLVPATAIVLAVMGIIPALSAFDGRKKLIWIACIASVSFLSLLASFFSIQSLHGDQNQLLGSDNFVTVTASIIDNRNIGGNFSLAVENTQPLPVYDVSLQIIRQISGLPSVGTLDLVRKFGDDALTRRFENRLNEDRDNFIKDVTRKPIIVGTVPPSNPPLYNHMNTGVELPVGNYVIYIHTRRGMFIENLRLYVENGRVRECHDIMKADYSVKLADTCAR
jgi:hypothetical protein